MIAGHFAESVVAVPIPEARALTSPWRGPHSLDAHVTVAAPFLDPLEIDDAVVGRLAACLADERAFDVVFDAVGWFDRRVVYLAPADPSPFRRLADVVTRTFYPDGAARGASRTVPHLTVAKNRPIDALDGAAATVAAGLPLSCRASEVVLYLYGSDTGSWRSRVRLPLARGPS